MGNSSYSIEFCKPSVLFVEYQCSWKCLIVNPPYIFFLINPWLEEFYWRGLLIDKTNNWPPWIANLYSTILFTIYHTSYAWHAELFRGIPFYAFILITAVIMVSSYQRTKSLWWGIIFHFLTNIFTLSIPVFYNMIEI